MPKIEILALLLCGYLYFVIAGKPESIYPKVRREDNVTDDYHGTKIADPYRWLEDPDSEETKEFVKAQNNLTFSYLEEANYRKEIRDRLTELWNYPKKGIPKRRGSRYFFFANSGLQNQCGSDWVTVHIKNVSTGEDLPEILRHTKWPSMSWTHDHKGFFYARYPPQEKNQTGTETDAVEQEKIYYHRLGTSQEEDTLVLEFPDQPKLSTSAEVSDDGKYMIIYTYEVINEEFIYFAPLKEPVATNFKEKLKLTQINKNPASFNYITNDDSLFYFITDLDAPNNKLVRIDLNKPNTRYWSTVIPEAKEVLDWAAPINTNMMFTSYTKDVKSTLELRHLYNGSLIMDFPLEIGSIGGTSGKRNDTVYFFKLSTFTNPGVTYKVNFTEEELKPVVIKDTKYVYQETLSKVDSSSLVAKQVFYKSKDGTKIPMYILSRKDLKLDGHSPAYLYSYGGFSSGQEPSYSTSYTVFAMNFRGLVAIPSIRGGGEYGKDWWDNGRLLKKQNCFDDFAAAAEYLIQNNYTKPSKLVINGTSNGGLLIGATINQRPELFGAAIPEVGVMDMLRFQKFTVGYYWCGEYGCSENKTHFDNLITYSPLHNIRMPKDESVQYPAILVKTADHDDRVVPLHSYKYISELQHRIGSNIRQKNPLLIRIEEKAGHGSGTPTSKVVRMARVVNHALPAFQGIKMSVCIFLD